MAEEQWGPWVPPKIVNNSKETEDVEKHKFQACAFIAGADKKRFNKVVEELTNAHLAGNNNYPGSVEAAMNMPSHRMDDMLEV